MAKKVSKTGKRMSKSATRKPTKGKNMKSGTKMSKRTARKSNRPMLKRDSKGRFIKMSLKKTAPSSRTVTKVRHQTKNKNIEHGIKRNNTKRHVDTKRKDSVRQKRNKHVKTRRRTKGKHEEEREMEENM